MKKIFTLLLFLTYWFGLYGQTIYTFTNCAATGRTGPTQGQVTTAYTATNLSGAVTVTTQGVQEWIVPGTGLYRIEVYGAQGARSGGKGASIVGDFTLTAGEIIKIVVGQTGVDGTNSGVTYSGGGGGGGTYVVRTPYNTNESILAIAGGGGALTNFGVTTAMDASAGTSGGSTISSGGGINGNGGNNGVANGDAAGGGGFFTNGTNSTDGASIGGVCFINGATGGSGSANSGGDGGFGGGGAGWNNSYNRSGGGGGYSGGQGGGWNGQQSGGGGGSYNTGANQVNTGGVNSGNGYVKVIAYVPMLTTTAISAITTTTASSGGNVTGDNGSAVTARGTCWSTSTGPTTANSKTSDGSGLGSFTSSITGLTAGTTYYVRAYATNSNGTGYGNEISFTASQFSQTITFGALSAQTYGAADFDPAATASSSLAVAYSTSDATIATIVANKVHIVKAGTVTIYADQAGNGTYSAAPQKSQNLTINPKSVTITGVTAATKVYDGTATATLSGGSVTTGIGSETLAITAGTGTFADKNVGSKAVTAIGYTLANGTNGGLAANYTLSAQPIVANQSITAKSVTITGVTAATKAYDGTTSAALSGGVATTGVGTETLALTAGTGSFADKNVGTKAVTAIGYALANGTNGGLAANYSLSAQPIVANQSITTKSVTITGVTAATKAYDGTTSATLSGGVATTGVGTETLAITAGTGAFADKNVGTKAVSASGYALANGTNGGLAANYTLSAQPTIANQSITAKSVTITGVTAATKVYDGNTTATLSGGSVTTGIGSETLAITAGTGTFIDKNVGSKTVTATGYALANGTNGGLAANYSLSAQPIVPDQSITAKSVTITGVTAATKAYDGTTSATLSGGAVTTGVGTETLALTAGTGSFADKNVGTKAVTAIGYALANGTNGGLAANYSLSAQPTVPNQSITVKSVTITGVTAASKVYDGDNTATLSGGEVATGVGTETLAITAGTGTFADKNVGTKEVTALGYTLADGTNGGLISNYTLSAQPTVPNQSITAKSVTITGVSAATKVYDGDNTATLSGGEVATGVGTETLAITAGIGTFADKNVGTKAVTATGYAIADGTNGGLAANYALSAQPIVADNAITAKSVTITGITAASKAYDGDNTATLSGGEVTIGVGTETLAITAGTGTFADKNVGTKAVTATGYALADGTNGGLAANYALSAQPTVADVAITTKSVTITGVSAASKAYDGDNSATLSGGEVATGVGTETLAITAGTGTFADKNVGTKEVTAIGYTLADGANGGLISNYTLSAQPTVPNQSITAKSVSITGVSVTTKVYDGDNSATLSGGEVTTGVGAETLAITAGTGTFADKNVGTKAVTAIGYALADGNNGGLATNYTLSAQPIVADNAITAKELTVTANNTSKTYGDVNPDFTVAYSGFAGSEGASDLTAAPTAAANVGQFSHVGDYDIVPSGGVATNYTFKYLSGLITINKAQLDITANNATRKVGEANPTFTFAYSGFKSTDNATDIDVLPTATCTANAVSVAGEYDIVVAGGSDNDYTLVLHNGKLTVSPATAIATAAVEAISVYPNPTVESLYIKGISTKTTVRIYNMQGKMVMSTIYNDSDEINVRNLPSGAYLIKLSGSKTNGAIRFIKQ